MAHHGTGGLQKHSIGSDYPYIMVATQHHGAGPLQWMVMDGATGNLSQRFRTSHAARIHMTSLRLRNLMHS